MKGRMMQEATGGKRELKLGARAHREPRRSETRRGRGLLMPFCDGQMAQRAGYERVRVVETTTRVVDEGLISAMPSSQCAGGRVDSNGAVPEAWRGPRSLI